MALDVNVPLAGNQIAADLIAMNANWEYLISGDGTAGRALRIGSLVIDNGSVGDSLKCNLSNAFNGDVIAQVDNVAKGATTGTYWTLDAAGEVLDIEASGITGNCVDALGFVTANLSTTVLMVSASDSTNKIRIYLMDAATGVKEDMTALVDVGAITVKILYITDA